MSEKEMNYRPSGGLLLPEFISHRFTRKKHGLTIEQYLFNSFNLSVLIRANPWLLFFFVDLLLFGVRKDALCGVRHRPQPTQRSALRMVIPRKLDCLCN